MIANVLVGLVAVIHLCIAYLEMVLWDTPRGHMVFRLTPEFARGLESACCQSGALQRLSRSRPDLGLYLGEAGFQ